MIRKKPALSHSPLLKILSFVLLGLSGISAAIGMAIRLSPLPQKPSAELTVEISADGYSAAMVESMLTIPAEHYLQKLPGLLKTTSVSKPGKAEITVFIDRSQPSPDPIMIENVLKNELPQNTTLSIHPVRGNFAPVQFSLRGDLPPAAITEIAENLIKDSLLALSQVANVTVEGGTNKVCRVIADPERMTATGVLPSDIVSTLSFLQVSSIHPQVTNEMLESAELNNSKVRIRDIASIETSAEKTGTTFSVNGKNAVLISIFPSTQARLNEMNTMVLPLINRLKKDLPASVHLEPVYLHQPAPLYPPAVILGWTFSFVLLITAFVFWIFSTRSRIAGLLAITSIIGATCSSWLASRNTASPEKKYCVLHYTASALNDEDVIKTKTWLNKTLADDPGVEFFTQKTSSDASDFPTTDINGECILLLNTQEHTQEEILEGLRKKMQQVPGLVTAFIRINSGSSYYPLQEPDITFSISGDDRNDLSELFSASEKIFRAAPGIADVVPDGTQIQAGINFRISREKALISSGDLEMQLKMLSGNYKTPLSLGSYQDEIPVYLAYKDFGKTNTIQNDKIISNAGELIPVSAAAEISYEKNYYKLLRENGKSAVLLTAQNGTEDPDAIENLRKEIGAQVKPKPGMKLEFRLLPKNSYPSWPGRTCLLLCSVTAVAMLLSLTLKKAA